MVRRSALLVVAICAVIAAACSGGSNGSPASTAQPRTADSPPARQAGSGPTASVEPRSGPPGSEVTVTGSGWPAGVSVDVTGTLPTGVSAPPYATVVTDGSGAFVAHFRLEKTPDGTDLQTGRYNLIARTSSAAVDIPFSVETRRPITGPGPGG